MQRSWTVVASVGSASTRRPIEVRSRPASGSAPWAWSSGRSSPDPPVPSRWARPAASSAACAAASTTPASTTSSCDPSSKEIEKRKSALFVLYEGSWEHSIGLIEQAITDEHALLFNSTLPADKAAALQALVEPAVEALGGEEVVADYELEVEEAPEVAPAEAPAEEAARRLPVGSGCRVGGGCAPAEVRADDLTQLVGIGPKAAAALAAAGVTTYAALAELNEPQLRRALHDGDMVPPANVGTWPMQASLASKGDWQGLMKYNNQAAEVATRPPEGGGGRRRAVRRPDPAPRHRAADRVDPQRRRDHELQPAPAREHAATCARSSPPAVRCRRRASTRGRPRPRTPRGAIGPGSPDTTGGDPGVGMWLLHRCRIPARRGPGARMSQARHGPLAEVARLADDAAR